jgi:dolichol-phosphate mannosyltransferase
MSVISVVSPVYGCKDCLFELYFRLKKTLEKITPDFEIILVNDSSPDGAWESIVELVRSDKRVKGISLSRNFGQQYAISAGLDHCSGEWIVVMDCDLQDKPEEIFNLYSKTIENYDVVFGRRKLRQDKMVKRLLSRFFYKIFDYFTENETDSTVSNFGIYSKQVIQNYLQLRERSRLFPLLIKWQGFNIAYVDVEHSNRKTGKSSYTFTKLFNLAIDIIVSQSNKPLKISIKFGFSMAFFSMIYLIYLVVRKLFMEIPLGWTSIMVTVFFIGGLIFANLGLIGLYLGKIYNELKNRPLYIIKSTIGEFNNKENA